MIEFIRHLFKGWERRDDKEYRDKLQRVEQLTARQQRQVRHLRRERDLHSRRHRGMQN